MSSGSSCSSCWCGLCHVRCACMAGQKYNKTAYFLVCGRRSHGDCPGSSFHCVLCSSLLHPKLISNNHQSSIVAADLLKANRLEQHTLDLESTLKSMLLEIGHILL